MEVNWNLKIAAMKIQEKEGGEDRLRYVSVAGMNRTGYIVTGKGILNIALRGSKKGAHERC